MGVPFDQPGYFDLKALAAYSSCSVRWLRDRLADCARPLPYHRVEGKLLVKKEDFDQWIEDYRICRRPRELDQIVDEVMSNFLPAPHRA